MMLQVRVRTGGSPFWTVAAIALCLNAPALVAQDLRTEVVRLRQENEELKGRIARLEALVEALTAEVASLRIEARATAVNTAKSAKQLDRLAPAGDALQTRVIA